MIIFKDTAKRGPKDVGPMAHGVTFQATVGGTTGVWLRMEDGIVRLWPNAGKFVSQVDTCLIVQDYRDVDLIMTVEEK